MPPRPPGGNRPFPVQAASQPQALVYEFLYNADLMRLTMYSVLNGSGAGTLQSWVQLVNDDIENSSVPKAIATEIELGQEG